MFISVITTFHNSETFILDCLQSFQSIRNISSVEHLLIDDGSNDRSREIINKNRRNNQIIIGREKVGRGKALNLGIQSSRGDYICILDSDDILNSSWIDYCLDIGLSDKSIHESVLFGDVIHFSAFDSFDVKKKFDRISNLPFREINNHHLYLRNPIPHVGTLIPKSKLDLVGNYTESRSAQFDWDLWLKLESVNTKFLHTKNYVAAKRLHRNQSFERKSHMSYTLKGVFLQISRSISQKYYLFPLVFPITLARIIWSIFPQSFRSRFYR